MTHFAANCPPWWNSYEQHFSQSSSKHNSLNVQPPPQLPQEARQLGLRCQDQDSLSAQSTSQIDHEVTAMGRTNSQDQSISSESVQNESYGKQGEGQSKPFFLMDNGTSSSQIDFSQSSCIPYPYTDPYHGGLFAAYGPPPFIQPQMMGITPSRVPLPADLAEDGPIYVNAKQYHGILRRRQTRAKLEAQNKLLKSRKPYLHESRHQHALNRVRGSGGRFLSMKKLQEPHNPHPHPTTDSQFIPVSAPEPEVSHCHCQPNTGQITGSRPNHRFPAFSPHLDLDVTTQK